MKKNEIRGRRFTCLRLLEKMRFFENYKFGKRACNTQPSVSISLQSHFEIISVLQRSHFGSASVSRGCHFCMFSIALPSHIDLICHFQFKRGLHPMFTNSNGWPADRPRDASDKLSGNRQFAQLGKEDLLITETDTSLALKIIQHEDFRIHLEVKNTIETLIKIYMHRACGMCRLWNKYGCPEPIRYQTIYSPKFTNSVKIHIQHIMHASQYATSILRTFRWPTQKMITMRP